MHTRRVQVVLGLLLAAITTLTIAPFVFGAYITFVLTLIFIYLLPTLSMRMSLIAGQTNIGVVGFFAIGGYTSAALAIKLHIPVFIALFAGGIMAAFIGLLIGAIIMNLGDLYFIIITWGFLELVRSVAIKATPLTGGPFGLVDIPPLSIAGLRLSDITEYFFVFIFTATILLVLYRLESSRLGLTWKGIAQAPSLAEAVGINVHRFKLISFVVSCFASGLGGALYAHHMSILQPVTFTFLLATTVIIWNFFGGLQHFLGPVVGAVVLLLAVEPLRGLESYEMIAYAGVIIVVTVFVPNGLISLPDRVSQGLGYLGRREVPVSEESAAGGKNASVPTE